MSTSWKPRPLPPVKRQRPAPEKPWKAWIDQSGGARYWDPNLVGHFVSYDQPPFGRSNFDWLDKPPPQTLRGTVIYSEDEDAEDDDDPYGLFADRNDGAVDGAGLDHSTSDQPVLEGTTPTSASNATTATTAATATTATTAKVNYTANAAGKDHEQ